MVVKCLYCYGHDSQLLPRNGGDIRDRSQHVKSFFGQDLHKFSGEAIAVVTVYTSYVDNKKTGDIIFHYYRLNQVPFPLPLMTNSRRTPPPPTSPPPQPSQPSRRMPCAGLHGKIGKFSNHICPACLPAH